MRRGDDSAALQHLEKALDICNSGESVRVQWRMSQIYDRKDMAEEARKLRETAKKVRNELLDTGGYAIVENDEEAGWDGLIGLLWWACWWVLG
jgi:hypothetical protein